MQAATNGQAVVLDPTLALSCTAPVSGVYTFDTNGSQFDTMLLLESARLRERPCVTMTADLVFPVKCWICRCK